MYIFIGLGTPKNGDEKKLWRNYAPKKSSFSLKSSNFVTRHENHYVTKLADWYDNSVTREMHKKLGPRGWQRSKIDCQQLGSEFRQPLIKKKIWDHVKDIQRKKLIYAKIVSKLGDLTVPIFGIMDDGFHNFYLPFWGKIV